MGDCHCNTRSYVYPKGIDTQLYGNNNNIMLMVAHSFAGVNFTDGEALQGSER